MLEVCLRYGTALFSLALETGKVIKWQKEMKELIYLIEENGELLELLNSKFVSIDERKDIVDNVLLFEDEELSSFIKLILDNGRISYLKDILYSFKNTSMSIT